MTIERFEDLDLTHRYHLADYLSWGFQERVELLWGWVTRLFRRLADALDPHGCEVFVAPTDVGTARSEEGEFVGLAPQAEDSEEIAATAFDNVSLTGASIFP